MSKKFTSFLVVLAALLLTVPTQAQLAKKAARQQVTLQAGPLKVNDVQKVKAAKAKAESKLEGQAFRGFKSVFQEKNVLPQYESTSGLFKPRFCESFMEMSAMNTERVTPLTRRASGEEKDANGIITSPAEGVAKVYTRSGKAYKYANSAVSVIDQSGTTQIVECEDGTVYIKDIVASYATGAWVKGTKSGNTITVPTKQPINYNSQYGATLSPRWATGDGTANPVAADELADNFTFVVDEAANTISLQNTTATQFMAVLWDDDNSYTGNGVYETVYTYSNDYVPPTTVTVTPPTDLETATWYANGHTYSSGSLSPYTNQVSVGFAEDKVYIKGMFTSFPNAWMMGTIEGTTVTFAGLQFQGVYGGTYDIYATGGDNSGLKDYVMTYDALSGTLSSENALFANAATDKIYYLTYITDITITKDTPTESEATTGDPIDALPYSNALASADDFGVFGVLDSNADGKTWDYSDSYGAYYSYSSSAVADDWLISPAIKLEAGKKYHFAIDAKVAGANFPERFEVLLGTEAKASALTQSVIAATEVTAIEYVTYENAAVEVAETGYYHFGIHAISDADMFRLMVANFLVEAAPEPTAPAAVTDFAVAQTEGKLEAVVSFKAPTKTVAGDDLTDLTKIDVLRDGNVINSISPSINWVAADQGYENSQDITSIDFGAGLTAALAQNDASTHPRYWANDKSLRLYDKNSMTISGGVIKKVVFTFVSSSNNKLAAEGLVVDGATGTWTGSANEIAFTATGGKAFIQKIEIEYEGTLTPGAEYSYTDNAEDLTIGTHVYQVIPYNASGIGIKSEEKSIFLSVALEAPYTFDFSENLLDLFTVIDNNNDGKTWQWNANGYAYYPYSEANDADDYLITLPFNLKAGKRYNVIVNARNSGYTETFEVKAGKAATVEGLTETVIAETAPTEEAEDYEGVFSPTEDGQYYFAIHATSPADQYNLIVSSLTIEIAPELTAPAAVADLTATAGAEGALEANLAFTAPAKAINDDALTGNVDVKIYRDGELVNTLTGVAVGSAQSWKDTNVENGKIYTYYVVAVNESGDGDKSEKVKVFVGVDALGAVPGFTASNVTPSTITFTWNAAEGVHGGYINTAAIEYTIYSMHVEEVEIIPGWTMQELVADEAVATVTGGTTATIDYNTLQGEQDYQYFGISAALGTDETEPADAYTAVLVGAPYELPIAESFTDKTLHYNWESNGGLGIDTYSSDEDGVALKLYNNGNGSEVYFALPRVDLVSAANPTIIFDAFNGQNVDKVKVVGSADGADLTVLGEFNLSSDYTTIKQVLTSIKGTAYSSVGILATIPTASVSQYEDNVVIDNIRIVDLYEYNLVADIKAPKSVVAGQKAKIVATVSNEGENPAKDYTVTVKAGEEVLTTVLGSEELAPFAKDEIEVEYETSIFDEAGDVNLTVTVDYENELYPDDNTANTIITVKEPAAAAPENLTATDKGVDGVDLAWTVVAAGTEEVFENFTSYENGANEALGDWTLVNNNGASKGSIFNDLSLANDGLVKAWEVMKPSEYGIGNTLFNGPNGSLEEAYLISAYNLDGQSYPDNDDWLISPELPGIAQEISFAIGALDVQYGPSSYEVLVSSTDSEIASFTKVAEGTLTSAGWNSVTAQLPEGTKYFAIRNNTSGDGAMCVMLGDIKFTANSSATVTSFNIYYNNEKIATVDGDKTTYTVAADKVEVGTQTFGVSAVYANGAESRVTTAAIEIVTGIEQIAADGKPVDVYSIDGKLIRNQAKSLDGLKGLYIVNGKKIMVK